jgi:cell filamentation protein
VSAEDPYLYPSTDVLRNKLGITDPDLLEAAERALVAQRAAEGIPSGAFDLIHLQAIHHHLFQDIYDWAGELRRVEISKGGHQFQFRRFIEIGMTDVYRRLTEKDFLKRLTPADFAKEVAHIVGDVNYVHPFREGNGRAQLFYLEQLAARAGHPIDLTRVDPSFWVDASRRAHVSDYASMAKEIARAMEDRED